MEISKSTLETKVKLKSKLKAKSQRENLQNLMRKCKTTTILTYDSLKHKNAPDPVDEPVLCLCITENRLLAVFQRKMSFVLISLAQSTKNAKDTTVQ